MSEKLKPCPFCGHKTIQESFFDLPCKVYRIRCPRCYIFMDNTSEHMVMKAWNTRPIEDALKKRIEELEAICEKLLWLHSDENETARTFGLRIDGLHFGDHMDIVLSGARKALEVGK